MLTFTILVTLSETEINNVHTVLSRFGSTNKKVIGFNIAMDDSFLVDFLYALYHLDCDQQYSLKIKRSFACLKQVFERRS
jgi:hypothetical protein